MATPGGSDLEPKGQHLHPSSSSSSSSSSSRSSSSFTSGDSRSVMRSNATFTEPTSLTIRVLEEITDNFSEERALGQGAYGKVYKGTLENGEEIAVKILYNNMQAINDEQFQHEFDNLMMLNHKNIVRLVGYCYETRRQHVEFQGRIVFGETTYRALCFEYMHMGSLQRHLSDETLGLDWQTRYKVIKGTCEGLKYLHEGFKEPIYHLDLKPDNILLDRNMVPKLADFGLSKLFGEEQTRVTQSPVGTIGYMPPEYLFRQVVSKKLDIFSLGVVITKIIAGPGGHTRSAEMPYQEFLDQVHENWRKRLEATCTSPMLEANCQQVSICTEIGLRCMEMDRYKRPSIVDIVHKLDETETMIQKANSPVNCQKDEVTNLVKVETFTRNNVINATKTCKKFPVLVQVTVGRQAGEMPGAGADIVAVLNLTTEWEMSMDDMKQAVMIIVEKLGPNDRLSIVSLENNVHSVMELMYMSSHGRDVARLKINELVLGKGKFLGAALREGAQILRGRGFWESSSRTGCIMLVSSARRYPQILKQEISQEFPVHTFALGYHNPWEMKYIADMTSGTYSYVELNTECVKYALTLFIAGLTSLAAKFLNMTFQAHNDVTIFSIESGGYRNLVSLDKQSGKIDIDYIFSGEQKNFIIYLTVPRGNEELIMTVGGSYQSLNSSKELLVMDGVIVQRPYRRCVPEELVIHHKVAAELLRIRYKNSILAIQNQDLSGHMLKTMWDKTKDSDEGRAVSVETLADLDEEVTQMQKGNRQYMLSWLSCHEWQRATTKGKPFYSSTFQTMEQQHADGVATTVKVETFSNKTILGTRYDEYFHVLVQITGAPWHRVEEMPRTGVDVIAVLDVGLRDLEEAMKMLVNKLSPNDRLCLMVLKTNVHPVLRTNVHRVTELMYISDHGQDIDKLNIDELVNGNGKYLGTALREGAQILRGRGVWESSTRTGCIMLVSSAGTYPDILEQEISKEFPVHTFALGYHCAREMKYLANMTSGTYSYVDLDTDIENALALFLTGLTSVVATCIKITLQVHDEVTISSIKSGGYSNLVSLDKRSGTIDIYNIYAGEQKKFIVTLIVPRGKEKQKLMSVGGRYQSLNARKELAGMDVIVLRSSWDSYLSEKLVIHPKVAAEILRFQYMEGILDIQNQDVNDYSIQSEQAVSSHWLKMMWKMAKIQYVESALDRQKFEREMVLSGHLQEMLWGVVKHSHAGVVPEETLSDLEKDIAEIHKGNKQYMLSWLSCHEWQRATTKGKPSNSTAFQTIGQQYADGGTTLVKVEGFTRCNTIMSTGMSSKFPVLVRVTVAPWHHVEEMPRAGVDIVAMLDVSRSMQGERLERLKQAMMIVIDKLGPNDRLSILTLQTHTHQLTKLTYMSDDQGHGWDAARLKISELETSNGRDMGHITGGTLLQGARILRSRGADESRSRLGCMIFLSDLSECPEIFRIQLSPEFPVHTFGLGADHNPKVMKYIADETLGTYSFINQDISNLKYALMLFITGLTSIAVSSVQITVRAHFGVTISSIESGGYIHHVESDKMSGTININHIYAGGQKDFIVNLTVGNGRKDLLTIGGQYQSLNKSKSLARTDLSVPWPWSTCSPDKLAIHHDVAAELMRTKLQKEVSAMTEKKHLTGKDLQEMWDMIKDSDNGHATPEEILYSLSMDVAEMKRDVSGLAYMLSWLSCHKWQRATTKGTPNNSSAFQTIGQHTDEGSSMVKVETFTRSKEIPSDNMCNKFPVLVRITAAPRRLAEEMPRAGVDIVAVLDISRRMRGEKLDHMKQAMMVVIDKLGVDDRLSIVSFNTYEDRLMKLTYMSNQHRDVARLTINKLVAGGQNDMGAGLREGAQILWWRGEESSHRVGCMMLLSDGEYPDIFQTQLNPEFPVHTFGLGIDHNPNVMKYIADMTSGTYSFINQDIDSIKDALKLLITGLTSVAAMSIKISLRAGEGVTISSIESGGYVNHVKYDGRSGKIDIYNIYAGERKDFIVYLRVAEGKKELMTIGGRYLSHDTVKHLAYTDVFVQRLHQECLPDDLAIQPDVAAELVRIRLEKGISAMLEQGPSSIELQQIWDGIIDSDEGRGAPKETLSGLNMDVTEMKRDIEHPEEYRKTGLPYTLSWLTSHKWQRATTKGAHSSPGSFQTTGQDADERKTPSHQPM